MAMNLSFQRRIAAEILKCSPKRVYFLPDALDRIKEAMTKEDIRSLINEGVILKLQKKGVSRARARELHKKKKKGRRRGPGSRKGKATARQGGKKRIWINKVRPQRRFIKELKSQNIIPNDLYRKLYRLIKGGFFRSRRHIEIYLKDLGILTEKQQIALEKELNKETTGVKSDKEKSTKESNAKENINEENNNINNKK